MTILEAINRIDTLRPNNYSVNDKIRWLSNLDHSIKKEIIDTHDGADVEFKGYDESTPQTTEMLVPSPYDEVYVYWLESQIDYTNGEYGKYNNSATAYNTAYSAFERYYNRQNMPKSKKLKFF